MSPFDGSTTGRGLRLGFVSGRFGAREGSSVWVDRGLGRLIDTLGRGVAEINVALSLAPARRPLQEHELDIELDQFVPLPYMASVRAGFHRVAGCVEAFREVERRSDVLVVQLPIQAPLALLSPRKPRVYHVCADQRALVRAASRFAPWERGAALAVAEGTDLLQRALGRRSDARVVTHGEELLARYGPDRGRAVVSSTLLAHEIDSVKRSRPLDAPFRVLFVGYLRPEKGVDVLLAAFERLIKRLGNAELQIVGAQDHHDGAVRAALDAAQRRLGSSRIQLLGPRNFGPELFACYADADVLAVPSLSEGTPRVLVEARAFGCPVIGTRVGGIPTSIDHERDGLLVPASDASALEDALYRIATDQGMRSRLIAGGFARARRCTVDTFAQDLLAEAGRAASGNLSGKDRS